MKQDITSFFHDFRQELLINAEAVNSFALAAFMEIVTNELTDSGFSEGFEFCHYRAQRGIRVDGYWFDDEGTLDLFIADFDSRESLTSLNKTDFEAIFKRLINFFQSCIEKNLADKQELRLTASSEIPSLMLLKPISKALSAHLPASSICFISSESLISFISCIFSDTFKN